MMKKRTIIQASLAALLVSCASSDESNNNNGNTSTPTTKAYFLDSAVSGLRYSSASHQGTTDINGGFAYEPGEATTFSFRGLTLGIVTMASGSSVVTPLDLFSTTDVNHQGVKNTLVLLQSLDSDQNPANGIELPANIPGGTTYDLSTLNIQSPIFQSGILALVNASGTTVPALVTEVDALNHFNNSLVAIAATPTLVGRWIESLATSSEVNAVYDFANDQSLVVTEFENCSSNFIAAESSAIRNCTQNNLALTWSLSGKTLTMAGGALSDVCRVTTATQNRIEAACVFTGSGLGTELVQFERDIPALADNLMSPTYREVATGGTTSYTDFTFNVDQTGSYAYYNSAGVAGTAGGDIGTFTWSTTATQLSYSGTDNTPAPFSATHTLLNQAKGALVTSLPAGTTTLIPNFNATLAAGMITQTLYGVYDAISGACKQVYTFENTQNLLRKETSVGTVDACQYASPVTLPQAGDLGLYTYTYQNGAMVINGGGGSEVCWPISMSKGSLPSVLVACTNTTNATAMNLEIWAGF